MPFDEQLLLQLLQACANAEPEPLYPARFAKDAHIDRGALDRLLDELRRRGLVRLTEWVRDLGQGCALTDAGRQSLASKRLPSQPPRTPEYARAPTNDDRGEIVRAAIMYPAVPYVGRVLIGLNIAFFLFGAVYAGLHDYSIGEYFYGGSPTTNNVLVRIGGLFPPLLRNDPQVPRPHFEIIILSFFLHIGLLHLGMNMYMLFGFGALIESMWGRWRFLAIYFVAGIVGSCLVAIVQFAEDPELYPVTAGASGALFGIFAALVVWFGMNYQHLPPQVIDAFKRNLSINLILLVGINFVPGVSWQGHLGGAIGGALAALLLHVQRFHPSAVVRALALVAVPFVPIGFFVGVLWMAGWF